MIAAGLRRVVIALADPDPRVAGGGIAQLKAAGIEVISGVRQAEAAQQNRAFLHRIRTGRPWGLLKWAMSLDGRTALSNGASQWISSPPARSWVHQLRAGVDAVIVGGGTVRADNPLLTSRGQRSPEPLRVVLSRTLICQGRPALGSNQRRHVGGPWPRGLSEAKQQLDQLGVERIELVACEPAALLEALAQRGCNRVLWECGPHLAAAAIASGCVQETAAVVAPALLGGAAARTPLGDLGFTAMDQVIRLSPNTPQALGSDWLFQSLLPDD